jgi:hypothetical protein
VGGKLNRLGWITNFNVSRPEQTQIQHVPLGYQLFNARPRRIVAASSLPRYGSRSLPG